MVIVRDQSTTQLIYVASYLMHIEKRFHQRRPPKPPRTLTGVIFLIYALLVLYYVDSYSIQDDSKFTTCFRFICRHLNLITKQLLLFSSGTYFPCLLQFGLLLNHEKQYINIFALVIIIEM